jgi:allantoicase
MKDADHSTADFTRLTDLASARVGGRALAASDDFFAPKANLVNPAPPVFLADKYTSRGKWMDGWESRRRRTPGHDWCVIALGIRGRIRGVVVDTSHFTGNFPSHCSIDAADAARVLRPRDYGGDGALWISVLPKTELRGDSRHVFPIDADRPWTHVRLNIFPDGGVARLRVHGEPEVDWRAIRRGKQAVDLASIRLGGLALQASDSHFGALDNLIMPGRALTMADGWETRRRRGPGHDWAIVRLGHPGRISRIEIDTNHFKGNYPESASVEGCLSADASVDADLTAASWFEILPRSPLKPHRRHFFTRELLRPGMDVSHVRLNIFPDGGVSRLRVYGRTGTD